MNYSAIGLMSGSSLDGLDIVLVTFERANSTWFYKIRAADCSSFSPVWRQKLQDATSLCAKDYLLLDVDFGRYCGEKVKEFLAHHKTITPVDVIGSHGHTTFHIPGKYMTHQLGNGAALAAAANFPVVADLRSMDVALGGQGAPIVPIGEKLLFPQYKYFLNIGGICNVSIHRQAEVIAFDVAPANRVLNMLAGLVDEPYDKGGSMAADGRVNHKLLETLNAQAYYQMPFPKSLANDFGTSVTFPLIMSAGLAVTDALCTYCEHIAIQLKNALQPLQTDSGERILVTGGGALNAFLAGRISHHLRELKTEVVIPDMETVQYKEALIMAFIAVLRLAEEPNVLASVTGARRDSSGGSLWSVK